jgi:hypothetical protein
MLDTQKMELYLEQSDEWIEGVAMGFNHPWEHIHGKIRVELPLVPAQRFHFEYRNGDIWMRWPVGPGLALRTWDYDHPDDRQCVELYLAELKILKMLEEAVEL